MISSDDYLEKHYRRKFGNHPPWGNMPSLYKHISGNLSSIPLGIERGGERLPDLTSDSDVNGLPGSRDGMIIHHVGLRENFELADEVFRTLKNAIENSSEIALSRLYGLLLEDRIIEFIDPLLERILETGELDMQALHFLARWWVLEAADRGPLKFAIALLGIFNDEEDVNLLMELGRDEEFTLYCAVALSNSRTDPNPLLWELGRNVFGWGRIHVVELLTECDEPQIRDWILRHGYKNSVRYGYLAATCARVGDLARELESDIVDDELLDAASEILRALFEMGAMEDIADYEDGARATEGLLRHLQFHKPDLKHLLAVSKIHDRILRDETDWDFRESQGWTEEFRQHILQMCETIMFRPGWRDQVFRVLLSVTDEDFPLIKETAEILGIDLWEWHVARLRENPADCNRWKCILGKLTLKRMIKVLTLAGELLPSPIQLEKKRLESNLQSVGGGDCLKLVLHKLEDFPGLGWTLLETALQSPQVADRSAALNVLSAWGPDNWTFEIREILQNRLQSEPRPEIKDGIDRLLRGRSYSVVFPEEIEFGEDGELTLLL